MSRDVYAKIIDLMIEAARLAQAVGITNILQPGLVKEMIIAEHLDIESSRPREMLMPVTKTIHPSCTSICLARKVAQGSLTGCSRSLQQNDKSL